MQALERREEVRRIPIIVDISYDLFAAIQDFRLERGAVNRATANAGNIGGGTAQAEIAALRESSAKSLDTALAKLSSFKVEGVESTIEEIGASRQAFVALRGAVDEALKLPVAERAASIFLRSGSKPTAGSFVRSTCWPANWRVSSAGPTPLSPK